MSRKISFVEYFPAAFFVAMAVYFAAILQVGIAPESPGSWALFMAMTPLARELSGLLGHLDFIGLIGAMVASCGIAALGVLLVRRPMFRRSGFIYSHVALLATIYAMSDEKVFVSASSDTVLQTSGWWHPNLGGLDIPTAVMFVGVLTACLYAHSRIIWKVRNPRRRIA